MAGALQERRREVDLYRDWQLPRPVRPERPQKGRYRQFHQFGVELFGINGPDIDAELIMLTHRLWRLFGISEHVTLQLNTLGQSSERAAYRDALVAYLAAKPAPPTSAFALGAGLFGRYAGPADLAASRKSALADEWAAKHDARGAVHG